jgi:HEAT repeat protein
VRRIVLSLFLVAASTAGAAAPPAPSGAAEEALYLGKPLGYWLRKLADGGPAHHKQAVEALTALGPDSGKAAPDVVRALVRALDDDEADVRRGALGALEALGTNARPAVPALVRLVRDRNVDFRARAIKALGATRTSDKAAVVALVRVVTSEPVDASLMVALEALEAAGPAAMKAALPTLVRRSKETGSPRVIRSLGAAGPDAVPYLSSLLAQTNAGTVAAAADGLKAVGPPARAAIPGLVAILKKARLPSIFADEGDPRWSATSALVAIGKDAVPCLVEALPHERAGYWAGFALARIGPPAIPAMTATLKGRDAGLRRKVVEVLGQMGRRAAPAVPALKGALNDPSPDVCQAAAEALKAIAEAPKDG